MDNQPKNKDLPTPKGSIFSNFNSLLSKDQKLPAPHELENNDRYATTMLSQVSEEFADDQN